jgi:hypothetical protein
MMSDKKKGWQIQYADMERWFAYNSWTSRYGEVTEPRVLEHLKMMEEETGRSYE